MNVRTRLALLGLLTILACLLGAGPAAAAPSPWWHLTQRLIPSRVEPEGQATIVVQAINLGNHPTAGRYEFSDQLPAGLELKKTEFTAPSPFPEVPGPDLGPSGPHKSLGLCHATSTSVSCSSETKLGEEFLKPVIPYEFLQMRLTVKAAPGAETGLNQLSASGGAAATAHIERQIPIGEEEVRFGLEHFALTPEEEGGAVATGAGSHPYQLTTDVSLNRNVDPFKPPAVPRNLEFKLPPGLIGNATVTPTCSDADFSNLYTGSPNFCPPDTVIGASIATFSITPGTETNPTVPVFNLQPAVGEPARFGFEVLGNPIILDTALRSGNGEDYGVTVASRNTTEIVGLTAATTVFWGTPADSSHDESRGWGCIRGGFYHEQGNVPPCGNTPQAKPLAFLTLPGDCAHPFNPLFEGLSWPLASAPGGVRAPSLEYQLADEAGNPLSLTACNQLPFSPVVQAEPTTDSASSPSGLSFNLDFHDEGLTNPEGLAQSQLNKTVVTLPEGFTINPSAGVGLAGCTPADYARETIDSPPGAGCPNESKLGTVEIETPLLTQKIHGSLYIAQPFENPFPEPAAGHPNGTLVALYIVAKNPETGILVKLAGKVTPNPVTGQLTTTFENNPQLPFDHFNFHFREGAQAPLITPATCGTYTTQAVLTPWSNPLAPLTETSSFTITKGFDGGACPSGGVASFHPGIQSGMLNNNAGVFSPFYLRLTRTDGEQELSGFSTNLPPGLTGSLTGIPFCPEAAIAAARAKTGGEEEANPSCPAASQVGHTLVGTGVGAVLAYVPGKIYLAGPFHGAPFSLVSVTSAKVGPFDLGTVVLRFGLNIDPYTAQVSVSPTTSEPIPTIIDGIVTHVRDIRVYIDRQNFTLNPTSCNPMAIGSTLNSPNGASTTVTSPFQAASCANLKFAPKFAVSTSGKTSKANGASLHVALTYPSAPQGTYANIAKVKVELPKQLPSRLTTLQKACTAAQFESNPAGCPSPSAIGTAKAVVPNIPEPLTGPVYFVSHGGEAFPSLEVVLQGYGVKVILVGSTFISKAGITSTTFKAVPDNPVNSFELTLPEGPYSALAANGNLCTQKLVMPADFTGQNGMQADYKTLVTVTGCPKKKALTRAQKLAAALKACHKDKNHAKRASCERAARKRYGPVKARKRKGR
jgi:hypothetical protein